MEKGKSQEVKSKDKEKQKILFSSVFMTLLTFLIIYLMVTSAKMLPLLMIMIGMVCVCMAIFVCNVISIMKTQKSEKQEEQEPYEELCKSFKASYLVIRKSFNDFEEQLKKVEKHIDMQSSEMIKMQKAVGKVTIYREKESANILLEMQEKLKQQIEEFEKNCEENFTSLQNGGMNQAEETNSIDTNNLIQQIKEILDSYVKAEETENRQQILQQTSTLEKISQDQNEQYEKINKIVMTEEKGQEQIKDIMNLQTVQKEKIEGMLQIQNEQIKGIEEVQETIDILQKTIAIVLADIPLQSEKKDDANELLVKELEKKVSELIEKNGQNMVSDMSTQAKENILEVTDKTQQTVENVVGELSKEVAQIANRIEELQNIMESFVTKQEKDEAEEEIIEEPEEEIIEEPEEEIIEEPEEEVQETEVMEENSVMTPEEIKALISHM